MNLCLLKAHVMSLRHALTLFTYNPKCNEIITSLLDPKGDAF